MASATKRRLGLPVFQDLEVLHGVAFRGECFSGLIPYDGTPIPLLTPTNDRDTFPIPPRRAICFAPDPATRSPHDDALALHSPSSGWKGDLHPSDCQTCSAHRPDTRCFQNTGCLQSDLFDRVSSVKVTHDQRVSPPFKLSHRSTVSRTNVASQNRSVEIEIRISPVQPGLSAPFSWQPRSNLLMFVADKRSCAGNLATNFAFWRKAAC